MVFEDRLGRPYALNLDADNGDEFWALDERDGVIDTGRISWDAEAREVVLTWEHLDATRGYRHRPGDPLPVVATDRRHPAFDLADWLVALDRDVGLPFLGRENIAFRFSEDGTVTVRRSQGDLGGTWRLSQGRVIVRVDGFKVRAGYLWRALAEHLRWPGISPA